MDELKVGDVVEYVGEAPDLKGTWKIGRFDDDDRHVWCEPISAKPSGGLSPVGGLYGLYKQNLKKQTFQFYDTVEYTGNFRPLQGQWRVIRYHARNENSDPNTSLWCVPLTAKPNELTSSLIDGYKCYTIFEANLRKIVDVCICPTRDLMQQGCTCGQFQREQGAKRGQLPGG